jgi:hypothetical protein
MRVCRIDADYLCGATARSKAMQQTRIMTLVTAALLMIDDAGTNRVICRVTFEAQRDRASQDGDGTNWNKAWDNHMLAIEAMASANYDAGKPLVHGKLLVDTLELTPQMPSRGELRA